MDTTYADAMNAFVDAVRAAIARVERECDPSNEEVATELRRLADEVESGAI